MDIRKKIRIIKFYVLVEIFRELKEVFESDPFYLDEDNIFKKNKDSLIKALFLKYSEDKIEKSFDKIIKKVNMNLGYGFKNFINNKDLVKFEKKLKIPLETLLYIISDDFLKYMVKKMDISFYKKNNFKKSRREIIEPTFFVIIQEKPRLFLKIFKDYMDNK